MNVLRNNLLNGSIFSASVLRSPSDAPAGGGSDTPQVTPAGGGGDGGSAQAGGFEPPPAGGASPTPASEGGSSAEGGDGGEAFDFQDPEDDQFIDPLSGAPGDESGAAGGEPVQPQQPTQPTVPPAQPATPPPSPPATPPAQPAQPAQPAGTPAAAAPATTTSTTTSDRPADAGAPETFVEIVNKNRDALVKDLAAQPRFALTPDEVAAIDQGDMSGVSRFGARVFVEAIETNARLLEQVLPGMVVSAVQAAQAQNAADNEFYGSYKELAPHRQVVHQLGTTLRGMNPTMPKEEFMQKLAVTAASFLGINLGARPNGAPPNAPPAPLVRAVPAGHSPVVSAVPIAGRAPQVGDDWGNFYEALEGGDDT